MKGITHKQAIQWIHRRSDGLLNESQLSALEEHLRSCDPCHAYAANLDGLSAHLQNEFHRRWDEEPGLSQNVMAHVTAKAKRIPMTNQIFSAAKLLAGAMALIVVAFAINFVVSRLQSTSPVTSTTETVDNVSRAEDRLLAFTSDQNGNSDIYTIHADGSGMTNITNNPAYDGFPFWSPDGKRIAFISNRDSSAQIYLMNADGSNVIQVTNGEGNYGFDGNGHTPWSPDGRKLIAFHASLGAQNGNLYVIDINEKTITTLTHEPGSYMHPSWSLDGNYIAFTADTGRTPKDLFIVGSDGNHLTKLTENLSNGEFFMFDYEWSPNGMSLFFTTNRNQQAFQDATYTSTLYEASMDGSMAVAAKATDRPIMSWWNGIAVRRESEPRLSWLRPDGSQSMLDLCPDNGQLFGTAHKRSYNGNLVVGSNCSDSGWMLYWANQDGTMIHPLLNSPISTSQDNLFQMTWSPDDQYIAFVGLNTAPPDVTETLYVLDIAKAREDPAVQPLKMTNSFGPSWQPVVIQEIVEEKPTPAPPASDRLIAFTAEQSGNSDIYTMRADGGEMANITNDPANDYSPLWSPDGKRIGFVSERNGNTDIFVMDSNGRNLRQLTDNPGYDGFFSWSPDGEKIAYLSSSGNDSNMAQLTVMNADGGDKTSLTDSGSYIFLGWSPDGEKLVYQKQDPEMIQNNEIHVSDVNGMNHYEWIAIIDEIKWQDEEHFIGHGWSGASEPPSWKIYRFDANGMDPIEIAVHDARIAALFQNTYIVEGVTELSWYSANGGPTLLGSENFNAHCQERGDRFLQETRHAISPDGAHAFVAVYCVEGRLWFYYENAEGSEFKQLTDFSVADPSQVLDGAWSPDGKYFILAIANRAGGNADLYLFDIEKMLTDPSTQPMRLTADEALKYEIVWQPAP